MDRFAIIESHWEDLPEHGKETKCVPLFNEATENRVWTQLTDTDAFPLQRALKMLSVDVFIPKGGFQKYTE